jgi:opacity protein-like surface antigen
MNKIIGILFAALSFLIPQTTQAELCPGMYTELRVGTNLITAVTMHNGSKHSLDFDPGIFASLSAGYRWTFGLRLEGEGSYRWNTIKYDFKDDLSEKYKLQGNLLNWSAMTNIYYDLPLCECVTGYFGAGIGYSYEKLCLKLLHYRGHKSNDSFAWQVMAGVSSPVWENTELALEYCFFQRTQTPQMHNHDLLLGLRYYF